MLLACVRPVRAVKSGCRDSVLNGGERQTPPQRLKLTKEARPFLEGKQLTPVRKASIEGARPYTRNQGAINPLAHARTLSELPGARSCAAPRVPVLHSSPPLSALSAHEGSGDQFVRFEFEPFAWAWRGFNQARQTPATKGRGYPKSYTAHVQTTPFQDPTDARAAAALASIMTMIISKIGYGGHHGYCGYYGYGFGSSSSAAFQQPLPTPSWRRRPSIQPIGISPCKAVRPRSFGVRMAAGSSPDEEQQGRFLWNREDTSKAFKGTMALMGIYSAILGVRDWMESVNWVLLIPFVPIPIGGVAGIRRTRAGFDCAL